MQEFQDLSNQNTDLSTEDDELISTGSNQIASINEKVDKSTRALNNRIKNCKGFRDTFDFIFDDELIGHGVRIKKTEIESALFSMLKTRTNARNVENLCPW